MNLEIKNQLTKTPRRQVLNDLASVITNRWIRSGFKLHELLNYAVGSGAANAEKISIEKVMKDLTSSLESLKSFDIGRVDSVPFPNFPELDYYSKYKEVMDKYEDFLNRRGVLFTKELRSNVVDLSEFNYYDGDEELDLNPYLLTIVFENGLTYHGSIFPGAYPDYEMVIDPNGVIVANKNILKIEIRRAL